MSQINVRNILVGYGDMYYAAQGTDLPDFASNTSDVRLQDSFDGDANWSYVGATQEGIELAYSPDYGEVEVDQFRDAAILFNQMTTVTLNTTLAEATLENLLLAWGLADEYLQQVDNKVASFSVGNAPVDPVERSVAFVGKGAPATYTEGDPAVTVTAARDRVYLGRRVLSIEGATLNLSRTENTAYPVSFRLLPDAAFRDSEYGVILDRIPGDTTVNPDPTNVFA
jgi:hypothetical protein